MDLKEEFMLQESARLNHHSSQPGIAPRRIKRRKKSVHQRLRESEIKKKRLQVKIQRSESEMTLLVAKASVFQEKADISNKVRIDKIMTSYKRKTIEHND